ncbi:lytic transglycosylase domain-containing protein [Agrobacterium pusense]|uniref:Uncharacterized protein n=1 Tax=Agrobacterium pusense TaxID=648995 RepID=A0AA44J2E1_9HYPH|nr:hypothetical protein [Agrobacterium pusense]NRF12281.1 hypothetical protein [Agrobacterium pusense]NRF22991.1 hypothetical protein [Agrobacterium pusense]
MVKLPTIQPRGAVTRGPQSSVSAAEVANPYQQIASAFDAIGETLQAKALDDARIEGEQAVSRGPDGKLNVDLKSNISAAGRMYNRQATQAFSAQMEIETKQAMIRLQQEANGNPDTFKVGAKGFRDGMLTKVPKELRGPIGTMIDSEIGASQAGVEQQKYRADTVMQKSTLLESITMKDNDRAALARQGGTGTEEYKRAYTETRTLWNEISGNPVFQISPKEAELRLKQAADRDMGEAILGEAERALENGGELEAKKLADRILTDTSISLSPATRRQYAGLVSGMIKTHNSEARAAVAPLRELAKDRVKSWDAGIDIDSAADIDLIENIRKGDPAFAHYLTGKMAAARENRAIRALSNGQQVQLLETVRGANVVDRIIGVESGGNATAKNPNSSATGAGQFISSTWMNMMKQYRPDLVAGKSASEVLAMRGDPALSREMTARYAQENAQFLRNQGVETTDGNVYLAHFLGPRGAVQVLKADPGASVASIVGEGVVNANEFLRGMSVADLRAWSMKKMGGGSSPITAEAAKTLQGEVTADLKSSLTDWKARVARGDIPDASSLSLMSRQLSLVDDQDLRDEYASIFRNSEAYQGGYAGDPAAVEAFISSLQARAAGQGLSLAELEVMDSFKAGSEAAERDKKNDGLGYAMKAYEGFPQMPLLDVNNPSSYGETLRQYQNGVNIAQARGEMQNIPAFRPAQAQAVARMWQTGNPDQLDSLTNAMASSLSPETLRATLTDKPIKEALSGAILSNDPVKHAAAMQQLDLLSERVSMPQLEADFGKDAVDRLQDWQAKVRYFTPEETAEWLKQRNDPKWEERTKPLVRKGQDEARKVSAAEVVDKLDTNRLFDAGGPIDEQTRRMMLNDYVTLVGDRNASLDNIDTAKSQGIERMRKVWGVTGVYGDRGGRVMPYPPEAFYPEVNGSKDWIGRELAGIAQGRNIDVANLSLVSDQKTETAAQRGDMPGYMITFIDPATGMEELLTDEQGRPIRHFFDPQAAQKAGLSAAQETRRTRNDPWLVLPGGTAVGPLYMGGADPADLQNRQDRIKEIRGEQNNRVEQKRRIRAEMKNANIPGMPVEPGAN